MKSDVNSCARYFLLLIIAFFVAVYQVHVFNRDIYAPMFHNSSDDF